MKKHGHAIAFLCALLFFVFTIALFSRHGDSMPEEVSHSAAKFTSQLDQAFDRAVLEYFVNDISRREGSGDLYSYASKLRLYKWLRKYFESEGKNNDLYDIYKLTEKHLFGWALRRYSSVSDLEASFKGRGIVMTVGTRFAPLAANGIRALRLLGCNLPIEVFFFGAADLSPEWISYFQRQKGVSVLDVGALIDLGQFKVPPWAIKSFAILASSFAEVIAIDSDAVILRNPENLFKEEGYVTTGTLFFKDRMMGGYTSRNATEWIETIIPEPISSSCKNTEFYNRRGNYMLKTGLMLIDKTRHLYGLMAACKMNSFPDSEDFRKMTCGDKEAFWLGMELAEEPFYFVPTPCGSIGVPSKNEQTGQEQVCGKLAHFDRDGKLLWFNDGLCEDKHKQKWDAAKLTHYIMEGKTRYEGMCLCGDVKALEAEVSSVLGKLHSAYQADPLDPTVGTSMKF